MNLLNKYYNKAWFNKIINPNIKIKKIEKHQISFFNKYFHLLNTIKIYLLFSIKTLFNSFKDVFLYRISNNKIKINKLIKKNSNFNNIFYKNNLINKIEDLTKKKPAIKINNDLSKNFNGDKVNKLNSRTELYFFNYINNYLCNNMQFTVNMVSSNFSVERFRQGTVREQYRTGVYMIMYFTVFFIIAVSTVFMKIKPNLSNAFDFIFILVILYLLPLRFKSIGLLSFWSDLVNILNTVLFNFIKFKK